MAVLLETSKGDMVLDLFVDECPTACKNFLKLAKCAAGAVCAHASGMHQCGMHHSC